MFIGSADKIIGGISISVANSVPWQYYCPEISNPSRIIMEPETPGSGIIQH